MDIKVTGTSSTKATDKKKKASKKSAASGVSFGSMLEAAEAMGSASAASAASGVSGVRSYTAAFEDDLPQDSKGRSIKLLKDLEDLQKDILVGAPTVAIEKLKRLLESDAIDKDSLPEQVRELIDEIELRASIEMAKMEAAKK